MGLRAALTALETAIAADPRAPVGITFNFGPRELTRHDSPPRIIWVPVPSTVEGPEKSITNDNPQQTLTRRIGVEAHCWGAASPSSTQAADYDAAEALADLVWSALYHVAEGSFAPASEDPGSPDSEQRGWLFVIRFDLLVPVTEPPLDVVAPLTLGLTTTVTQP